MELRVLGCSGGIGEQLRTTTLLLNENILIDAGTGVGDLTLDEMEKIHHVFITHSHLDHIAGLPLLIDSIFDRIKSPVTIHAQPETTKALKEHIFNNVIWPDFAILPTMDKPVIRFNNMKPGELFAIDEHSSLQMVKVKHVIPAVGYVIQTPDHTLAFTGDTSTNDHFWEMVNKLPRLDYLIVEAAFTNQDQELSRQAGHYCPKTLGEDITKLKHQPHIYLTHHKPGAEKKIFAECGQAIRTHKVTSLVGGQRITL